MANFLLNYPSYLILILLSGGEAMEAKNNASNVLIVDDEIGPRESLRMVLKPNYNVYTVRMDMPRFR